jgi:hypothetical protein
MRNWPKVDQNWGGAFCTTHLSFFGLAGNAHVRTKRAWLLLILNNFHYINVWIRQISKQIFIFPRKAILVWHTNRLHSLFLMTTQNRHLTEQRWHILPTSDKFPSSWSFQGQTCARISVLTVTLCSNNGSLHSNYQEFVQFTFKQSNG